MGNQNSGDVFPLFEVCYTPNKLASWNHLEHILPENDDPFGDFDGKYDLGIAHEE